MIKKYLKRKQYEKIKKYVESNIRMNLICIEKLSEHNIRGEANFVIENHKAQIVSLKEVLRFIENEEARVY